MRNSERSLYSNFRSIRKKKNVWRRKTKNIGTFGGEKKDVGKFLFQIWNWEYKKDTGVSRYREIDAYSHNLIFFFHKIFRGLFQLKKGHLNFPEFSYTICVYCYVTIERDVSFNWERNTYSTFCLFVYILFYFIFFFRNHKASLQLRKRCLNCAEYFLYYTQLLLGHRRCL